MLQRADARPGLLAQAEEIARGFEITPDHIQRLTRHFVRQLKDGLVNRRTWQLPAYVTRVPTGSETGKFLAVDLGGSNCRICLVDLHGDSTFTIVQSKHKVPPNVMVNKSYRPLFDFIASKIEAFLDTHLSSAEDLKSSGGAGTGHHERYSLGFTFSFTCEQTSLERATLIHWDKGWDIPDAIGKDPCVMLQEAIDKLGLPVTVAILANDSVGALLTRSYTSDQKMPTLGAVIFGTGTNAAYIEKLSNVKWLAKKVDEGEIMVMNTEWGCLGDKLDVLPTTPFDDELDRASTEPGSQLLEKRISGLYLGELLRLAILRLREIGAFDAKFSENSSLFQREGIDSSFLSQLAMADTNTKHASNLIEETLMAENVTADDALALQMVTTAIFRRAGRLAGASLSALIIQSGRLKSDSHDGKRQGVEITEYESPSTLETPVGALERFTYRLGYIWHRVLRFLGMESLVRKPTSCTRHRGVSKSPEHFSEGNIIDIGADGSLIEFYPNFEVEMRGAMREVPDIGPQGERKIRISLTKDGSGVGAALMAQAAMEMKASAKHLGSEQVLPA